MAVGTGIAALIAAIYFASRQTIILEKQADTARKQTAIQERQADIAKEQADIARQQLKIIEYQQQERSKEKCEANLAARIEGNYLVIKNEGPSDARNIALFLNGTPISTDKRFSSPLPEIVQQLLAGSDIKYRLVLTGGSSAILNLEMRWEDDSNKTRSAQTTLNVY